MRTYITDPLTEPVVVSGKIAAHLFAATSGTDSDWIVKLIDVFPEKHDTKGENFLVVGPWNHGGWARGTGPTPGRSGLGMDRVAH